MRKFSLYRLYTLNTPSTPCWKRTSKTELYKVQSINAIRAEHAIHAMLEKDFKDMVLQHSVHTQYTRLKRHPRLAPNELGCRLNYITSFKVLSTTRWRAMHLGWHIEGTNITLDLLPSQQWVYSVHGQHSLLSCNMYGVLACRASMAKIYSNTHTRSRYLVFIVIIYFQHILPTLSFITLPYPTCLF